MRVGILSESDADEAAVRILAEALLGRTFEVVRARVRSRGWTGVVNNLRPFYKHLHWQGDGDGMIVVLDSDDTPLHIPAHEAAGFQDEKCRCCELHRIVSDLSTQVARRQKPLLKIAIGLAIPSIEAWYQCGIDVHCTEARFAREPAPRLYDLRRELKRQSYGAFPAPQLLMKQKAVEHATRLGRDLGTLELHFPNGFGSLARSLRGWQG